MTFLRPLTAFITAFVAGIIENFTGSSCSKTGWNIPDRTCLVDACCDGTNCPPADHARHHTAAEKIRAGLRFAFTELMDDLAVWFLLGILIAGAISTLVPQTFVSDFGSGVWAYLGMLVVSLPMYVCATLSTPIAAALIMKGMSPGAALVLLMAGPATNMATIAMVGAMLGRRTLAVYLTTIVACTLAMAFVTDALYAMIGVSAQASVGQAAGEMLPRWVETSAAVLLGVLILAAYRRKISMSETYKRLRGGTHEKKLQAPQADCCNPVKPGDT